MGLDFHSRIAVRYLLKVKLSELYGSSFEDFFHDLMCLRYSDFADVRAAGSKGDLGSDGLTLVSKKLYACYGPQVFDLSALTRKFNSDLAKALEKRNGQFSTFVFVHNDIRGLHPELSALLANASESNARIAFEPFGFRRFRDEVSHLQRNQVEDLLGQPLPVDAIFSIPLEEVVPLLDHLARARALLQSQEEIVKPSAAKLDFNRFPDDAKEDLRRAIIQSHQIDEYYFHRDDVIESATKPRGPFVRSMILFAHDMTTRKMSYIILSNTY